MKRIWLTSALVFALAAFVTASSSERSARFTPKDHHTQRLPNQPKKDTQPNLDGVVEVSFTIDNQGKVQIVNINSTNPQLAEYVIKKLGKVKLTDGPSEPGKVVKYSFVFKKQT